MKRYLRCVRSIVLVATSMSALACVDSVGPGTSPDVLVPHPGASAQDSSSGALLDTVPPGRLRGMVVIPSGDSTSTWSVAAGTRIDVAVKDARTGVMSVVATTGSDASGRFLFAKLTTPTGLLFMRATPATGSAYRASPWLPAFSFVGPWATTAIAGVIEWSLGPYLVLERADSPPRQYVPVLALGHVRSDDGRLGIQGAVVAIDRVVPPKAGPAAGSPVSLGTVASARTDAEGFFLMELPGPGTYSSRVTMPVGSGFDNLPLQGYFTPEASTESSVISYLRFVTAQARQVGP
jgi:hypothetical protein